MKKLLKFMLTGSFALFALAACSEDEEPYVEPDNGSGTDESYYASLATISSSDSKFTKTDEGANVSFAQPGGTVVVNVSCGCDWYATTVNGTGWLSVNATDTSLSISADQLDTEEGRDASVVLATATEGIRFAIITVTQTGAAFVNLSTERLSFPRTSGSGSVTVESNVDWDYSYDKSAGWFSVERDGNDIVVTVIEYDGGDSRESVVTVTAGDSDTNKAEAQLAIIQAGNSLIMTYNITSTGTSAKLPLSGTVDCTVDWGDGTIESITSVQPSHTYNAAGEYDVVVSGTVTELSSKNISTSSNPLLDITAVKQWGNTGLTSMSYAFYYCGNLTTLPEDTFDAFSNVTTFIYAFYYCSLLEKIPEGFFDYCPETTDFSFAFGYCYAIEGIPAGLFDNCSKATTFQNTFVGDTLVSEIPVGLFDNCPLVTSFNATFDYCYAIKEIPTGLFDNCPLVTTFYRAFSNCSSIEKIPAGLFDNCPLVTTFYGVFQACVLVKEIPAGLFDNCPEVTTFQYSFYDLEALESIPAGLFANCPKVTTFAEVFQSCYSLEEIPAGLFDNNSSVTSFQQAFYHCYALQTIPEGLFDNCPAVTAMQSAFRDCPSLISVPADIFSKNLKITNFQLTFGDDVALTGESPYDTIDGVKVHLYERENYSDVYSKPTTTTNCFRDCTLLSDYYSIPSSWGGGGN